MSEIKFRVIDDNGEIYGLERLREGRWERTFSEDLPWEGGTFRKIAIREQFTGLKDKSGKRDLSAGDRIVIGGDRGVLVWDEYDLCWSLQLEGRDNNIQAICRFYTDEERDNIEYLGNIHETNQGSEPARQGVGPADS